jgi:Ca-activated chloride channel family protein
VPVTFEQPWFLLLLGLAAPVAWIGLTWFTTMSRLRAWTGVVARVALIALVAGMLAGASAVQWTSRLAVVAVVDVSRSVRTFAGAETGEVLQRTRQWLRDATPDRRADDLVGVVVFDGDAIATLTPTPDRDPELSLDHAIAPGTNIEQALRAAAALFPPDASRRLVLVSDGVETSGDALAAAEELGRGLGATPGPTPIDVVPLAYAARGEVLVERVDAPPRAAREAAVSVRVALRATEPTTGTLELLYEGAPIDINGAGAGRGRRLALDAGETVVTVEVELADANVHRFEPVFTPDNPADDRVTSNNRAEAFTVTPGQGAIAIVDGWGDGARSPLYRALDNAGLRVRSIAPAAFPTDLLALQSFDLIALDNVASDQLPRPTHQLLADYVEKLGGGLVMIGGPASLTAGAWRSTAIEPVLPVSLELPEDIILPSAAIMFVIDSSGSMHNSVLGGSRSQQEIANEATALAISTLDKTDLVGVIDFDTNTHTVVPLRKNSDPEASMRAVRRIAAGGGTVMYPAIAAAAAQLRAQEAEVKHVIVLSDGQSEGDRSQGLAIVRAMRDAGITVSTIAVGDGADVSTLAQLAAEGGGQFHPVQDPSTLPRIFIKEIRVVRKPEIRESPFVPVVLATGSPLTMGLPAGMPPLGGLVLTQPKPDQSITYAMATSEGEPVLAHWFVGRGQAAAFTSDASRWAAGWLDAGWPGYRQLWTRVARSIARPATSRTFDLVTVIDGDNAKIRVEALTDDGEPMDLLDMPGTLYLPDGTRRDLRLTQTAPGVYETDAPAPVEGNYVVALTPAAGDKPLGAVVGGASRAVGPEFRRLNSNVELLRAIAEASGGRVLDLDDPDAARLFDRAGVRPTRAAMPLWPALLLWTLVVFVIDVGTRRVAWDRLLSRQALAEWRAHTRDAARRQGEQAAATVAALKQAGQRAQPPATPRHPGTRAAGPARRVAPAADDPPPTPRPARPAAPADPGEGDRPADDTTTGGLLAAKRRARRRIDAERPGDATNNER